MENIPHISIVRDPLERYISLKSYICHPKGWFRPQVDYVSDKTHVWYFEDGFNDNFSNWLSSILEMKFNVKKLSSNHIYNELGQKLTLDYMDSDYKKHERTVEDEKYVRNFYKLDYLRWLRYN